MYLPRNVRVCNGRLFMKQLLKNWVGRNARGGEATHDRCASRDSSCGRSAAVGCSTRRQAPAQARRLQQTSAYGSSAAITP